MRQSNLILFAALLFAVAFAGTYVIAVQSQKGQTADTALIGGPFSLAGAYGKPVTDRDFRGKLMLVVFGYTHCPDVCPAELQTIAEVMDKLGSAADKVAPIFISVDPQRDTTEVLSPFVKAFNPNIVGLTGTPAEVASAAKAYRVYFRKVGSESDKGDYTVDHSAFIYLMDGQGNYVTHFTFASTSDVILAAITKHLNAVKSAKASSCPKTKDEFAAVVSRVSFA